VKVLLIDFYDSFTYNIYHYLESIGAEVQVWEDEQVEMDKINDFDCVIFSPGPGLPKDKKSIFPVLEKFGSTKKILGICLGMQGIAEFYGAKLYNQVVVKHGVSERIIILNHDTLFFNLPNDLDVGLYHSWAVDLADSKQLIRLAVSENNVDMAIKHKDLPIYGVQFHPESILTPEGKNILKNFLFNC
jgi:anthranilate synthase component II